ncbi:hypothetical protein EMVG_00130 [Emiliania huxleyi virus PS401]|nr:hypothetical protein EMVG_00130 [Emiliania huxleyi virus PS401]
MAWYNLRKPSAHTTKTHKPESKAKTLEVGKMGSMDNPTRWQRPVPIEVGEMQSMDASSTLPRSSDDRRYVSNSRRVQSSTAESM